MPLDGKKKVTTVPLEAVTLAGLNTKLPPAATSTLTNPDVLAGAEGAAAAEELVVAGPEGGAP